MRRLNKIGCSLTGLHREIMLLDIHPTWQPRNQSDCTIHVNGAYCKDLFSISFVNLTDFVIIRWSVDDRSPIDFVRILFLYSLLLGGLSMTDHLLISLEFSLFFIHFYFFRTLFCTHVHSKSTWSISFKFLSVIKPYDFKSNQLFQGH